MDPVPVIVKLFNTLTRKVEELTPQQKGIVRMYTCGPTVYDFAHIGNFRTYVFEDLLRRTLKFFGYRVEQVMNLTDVEDKTIRGAIAKNIPLDAYTKPYIEAFFADLKTLSIQSVEHYPKATDYISYMIEIIQKLLEKGTAYVGKDGSVYFSIHKFPGYGKLSHLELDELKEGASERGRLTQDEYDKERASDFVLWKSYDSQRDGSIYWESPFGKGRPGWHIECSAMAMKILGPTIDIHCGGVDNIFPHHENEIAQSECCSGKTFVRHWLHSEHLLVDHKKMSKSLGNFYTLRDLLNKGFSPREIRYVLLQTHYRIQLNFSFQELESAKGSLTRIGDFIQRLREVDHPEKNGSIDALILKTRERFCQALANDLNISLALSALFDLIREGNSLCDQNRMSEEEAKQILRLLSDFDEVLAVLPLEPEKMEIPTEILEAMQKREEARRTKISSLQTSLETSFMDKGISSKIPPQD
jgi:cysteinyl-tRNA synthetase